MTNNKRKLPTFKAGDRVWCILTGQWHVLEESHNDTYPIWIPIVTKFTIDGKISPYHANPVIFEKEQVLDIPEPKFEPEPGQLCFFWNTPLEDGQADFLRIDKFNKMITGTEPERYCDKKGYSWENCAPFNGELPEGVEL